MVQDELFFGVFTFKTGTVIAAGVTVLQATLMLICSFVNILDLDSKIRFADQDARVEMIYRNFQIGFIICLVLAVIIVVAIILLLVAISQNKSNFLLPWLIIEMLWIVLAIGGCVALLPRYLLTALLGFIAIGGMCYLWASVNVFRKELRDINYGN